MSMSDVSDMLYEYYKTNTTAKAPKCQGSQQPEAIVGSGATAAAVKYVVQTSPTSAETNEPSSIAAIATNGAASETASKNLQSDEMAGASFHPPTKYTNSNTIVPSTSTNNKCNIPPLMTAIPTSVVVPTSSAESFDIKPIINPDTGLVITPHLSIIKPATSSAENSQAVALAAALIRDSYHSLQQQMCAQEMIKMQTGKLNLKLEDANSIRILETFLRQQRVSECDTENTSEYNDDDEDDSRYSGFDDIHLMEGPKPHLSQMPHNVLASNSSSSCTPIPGDYFSDESQKLLNLAAHAQARALGNMEYSLGNFTKRSRKRGIIDGPNAIGPNGEQIYECLLCNKKYRWKSTLRRHENVECGGKEPGHQCPYCTYRSKQRGNLGVHVRKHHAHLPQLASKRRSKYSNQPDSNPSSANVSDDSNSKLLIDYSK